MVENTAIEYPSRLSLAQYPTPVQPLLRLREYLQGEIGAGYVPSLWIKRDDLTGSVLSGNKVRKLEFIVAEALEEGCDTLISCGGMQSNHCRATAFVAAAQGMRCHLLLREDIPAFPQPYDTGNLLLDRLAGAEVTRYPARDYFRNISDYKNEYVDYYRSKGHKAKWIPTGGSDATGLWGYIAAFEELTNACSLLGFTPDQIITATGSGGTQAGLLIGSKLMSSIHRAPSIPVLGMAVCDDEAYFQRKVKQDIGDWVVKYPSQSGPIQTAEANISDSINVNDDYIGLGYAKSTPSELETLKLLARLEGIVLDPVYTGKAFHGLLQKIAKRGYREDQHIVFVHTGGIFGLFSYAGDLKETFSKQ